MAMVLRSIWKRMPGVYVSTVMGDRLILEFCSGTNGTRRKGDQVDVLKAMFKTRPGAILDRMVNITIIKMAIAKMEGEEFLSSRRKYHCH